MSTSARFILFQLAVFLPFIIGHLIKSWVKEPQLFTRKLLRVNIIGLEPLINFWCIWRLHLSSDLMFLPLAGISLILIGFLMGMLFLTFLGLPGKKRPTFLLSSSLANHGFTMGGYFCYFFLGEKGLGLALILMLYFIPYVYCFVFPYAKVASHDASDKRGFWKKFILDPQNMPVLAMVSAFVLHLQRIPSPDIYFPIDFLLFMSIALYYLTLGVNFSGIDVRRLQKVHLSLATIKFIFAPLLAFLALKVVPLDPSIGSVIMIQSFMPTAIYSVVTALLFELDEDFAGKLFVGNTLLFLILVAPIMVLLKDTLLKL